MIKCEKHNILHKSSCPLCIKDNEEKTYTFTREVKRWGVEAGDYYNPQRHMYQGGTEKLLSEGVIEEE